MKATQIDLGFVKVHKKVFADIVQTAVETIDGVKLNPPSPWQKVIGSLFPKKIHGIEVDVDSETEVTLEVSVIVRYGLNIPELAKEIQDTVRASIQKSLDIHVKGININVEGIERPQP